MGREEILEICHDPQGYDLSSGLDATVSIITDYDEGVVASCSEFGRGEETEEAERCYAEVVAFEVCGWGFEDGI